MHNASVNVCVHSFVCTPVFSCFGSTPRSRIAGSRGIKEHVSCFLDFPLEGTSTEIISFRNENLVSGCLGGGVHSSPASVPGEQLTEIPVGDVALGELSFLPQAVQLWVLTDRHPLFKAVGIDSFSRYSPREMYLL